MREWQTAVSRLAAALAATLALGVGAGDLAAAASLRIKAAAAIPLLQAAWTRARIGEPRPTPWPSADSWPVARLRAPRIGFDSIVLAGATGKVLAFAPGWLRGSAPPGSEGNSVIAGHRDSHFAFLEELRVGDILTIERPEGQIYRYRVNGMEIVHERDAEATRADDRTQLTLITCYPFDALRPGGPLRYVVRAHPEPHPAEDADSVLASARGR